MAVNPESHTTLFRRCLPASGPGIIAKLRRIHFHKGKTLVCRQRGRAIVHLAMSAAAAAAAPDLQALLVHFLRRRKGPASGSIARAADIEHQVEAAAASHARKTDLRIGFLADPARRQLRGKRALCSARRIFQWNIADKLRVRPGRIEVQNIFARTLCSLHRGERGRISCLRMPLQGRRNASFTAASGPAKKTCQTQICLFLRQHCLQPRIFFPHGGRMDQQL